MTDMNPKVDAFLARAKKWQAELRALRQIALGCGLTEDLKWYKPCYTFQGANVVGLAGLKDYCWLMFFKGALLPDPDGILLKPGENSQSARVVKFTGVEQIMSMAPILTARIQDAIAVEKAGLKVEFKTEAELILPEELIRKLDEAPDLAAAFDALTPGRRRAYSLHFSQPKQSATRASRIEKCVPRILDGKGLNDR